MRRCRVGAWGMSHEAGDMVIGCLDSSAILNLYLSFASGSVVFWDMANKFARRPPTWANPLAKICREEQLKAQGLFRPIPYADAYCISNSMTPALSTPKDFVRLVSVHVH